MMLLATTGAFAQGNGKMCIRDSATTVLDHIKKMENTPLLKDIFFFWNKLKKRTNVEILKSYSEVMRELHLTVLDLSLIHI